ncbi:3-ketoacyl-CoA synthase 15 [Abeliophyllum distichum]|uniref:3-ketoacyl-CoA synthase 15 n=1 Tax=Abeliophyllum distichum TaxID=126358 RepID=A0ABD1PWX4_9LAMI
MRLELSRYDVCGGGTHYGKSGGLKTLACVVRCVTPSAFGLGLISDFGLVRCCSQVFSQILKILKEEFVELARKSDNPKDGREEVVMLMFRAVDDVLATTGIRIKDIKIFIVNYGIHNTTPSLSAMLINHYKLCHKIQRSSLGGLGCAAVVAAMDLAKDLLGAYPDSYVLVVSTDIVSFTWYDGNELDMLLPNSFFRMGPAAFFLSNHRLDRWRANITLILKFN